MSGFTMVSNELESADLDPYQFRMLVHIKRVGKSWEGVRTLAEKCKMSKSKAATTKDWLLDNGWIVWTVTDSGYAAVTAADPLPCDRPPYGQTQQNRPPHGQSVHHMDTERPPHGHKHTNISKPKEAYIAKDEIGKKREAITALVEMWCKLTSKAVPLSQQYARREYGEPAADFLERVGWDVDRAYTLLHDARADMLQRGMTPFKLSAAVPFAVAGLDMQKQVTNGKHPPAKDREGTILEDETGRFVIRNGKPERIEDDGPY